MVRIESNGLVVIGNGSVVVAFARISVAPVVEGFDVIGIQPDRLVVIGNGSVVVTFFPISEAPVLKSASDLRLESNGLAVGCDSPVIGAVVGICDALAHKGSIARSRLCFSLFAPLLLRPDSGEPLLLGFLTLALRFRLSCRFRLALLLRLSGS